MWKKKKAVVKKVVHEMRIPKPNIQRQRHQRTTENIGTRQELFSDLSIE
jgi:hypothetical protein